MPPKPPSAAVPRRWGDGSVLFGAAALGVALGVVGVTLVATSRQPGNRGVMALVLSLAIAVPLCVGLWAWYERENEWVGRALIGAALLFSLATFAQSDRAVLYSIGRVSFWFVEPVIAFLALTFPAGEFKTRVEKASFWAVAGIAVLLYFPTAFLVERYPVPSPYASCTTSCPKNAFMLLDDEPRAAHALIYPTREFAAALAFFAVAALLAIRLRKAPMVMRRPLAPVLALTTLFAVTLAAYFLVRRASPTSSALDFIGWLHILTLPGIGLAVLTGLLRRKVFEATALQRLAFRLRDHPEANELRRVLGEVLGDPSLEIVYRGRDPDEWVDAEGRRVDPPRETAWRCITEVYGGNHPVAALLYDRGLRDERELVAAAGSFALASLENTRLAAQVETSLDELQESRARIQAAADNERMRIERNLHDGAQQRLVALRMRLELAAKLTKRDPRRSSTLLLELGRELQEALEEVRSLARGIYPSVLADRGLEEALVAVARREPIATTIDAQDVSRYPTEVESAVYFCCLEALQNVAKHAQGATSVWISLVDDGALRFAVVDDGAGFSEEAPSTGTGVTHMRDRLAAVGGVLTIRSVPGEGTQVIGSIPLTDRVPSSLFA